MEPGACSRGLFNSGQQGLPVAAYNCEPFSYCCCCWGFGVCLQLSCVVQPFLVAVFDVAAVGCPSRSHHSEGQLHSLRFGFLGLQLV